MTTNQESPDLFQDTEFVQKRKNGTENTYSPVLQIQLGSNAYSTDRSKHLHTSRRQQFHYTVD